ncbi:hypothetical protein D9757_006498 [Collybiopsis confluens]|uniref:diphthine methyl ester synthase n=1 Tax=Collybiopsis confluens TaxID=2823264 RepID=A0A8H5HJJ4_9AGAR|nr:hypothetical protein D9757_006498 [Collybiopsis confluens]
MFCIVGLGLCDEKDITLRGLEAVKSASRVYLEAYTSILMIEKARLESFYGKEVIVADRDMVESEDGSNEILKNADKEDVCLLVVGDPFGATTHTDILIRARQLGIPTRVIHNASIMNAVGASGLQLYNFGQTISLVFFTETWKPDSFYDRIKENIDGGLHTLVLLDIKSDSFFFRGRKVYEPPRYMTVPQAVSQLLEIENMRREGVLDPDKTLAISMGRVGGFDQQRILAGPLCSLLRASPEDFGPPLHSLIIVGKRLHHLEVEYGELFAEDLGEAIAVAEEDGRNPELGQQGRKGGRELWRKVAHEAYGVALS